jgi:hypothetical protein
MFSFVYKMYCIIRLNSCKITCKNIIFQDNVNFDTYTVRDHLIPLNLEHFLHFFNTEKCSGSEYCEVLTRNKGVIND